MFEKVQSGAILVLACVILGALAQSPATPSVSTPAASPASSPAASTAASPAASSAAPPIAAPIASCVLAQGLDINQNALNGTLYSVAASPANYGTNVSCWEVIFEYSNSNSVLVINRHSNSSQVATPNVGYNVTGDLSNPNTLNGYEFSDAEKKQTFTYKLLTQIDNFSLVCGYETANNVTVEHAFIFSKTVPFNETALYSLEKSPIYANILSSVKNITQSEKCYKSSASRALPELFASLLMIYAFLQYLQQ